MSAKSDPITTQLSNVSFKVYTCKEIKHMSVLEITNPKTLDALGHSNAKGLCDNALGPIDRNDVCSTCGSNYNDCNGHYGHISLSVPIFNPFLIRQLFQLLKVTCLKCHHLLFSPVDLELVLAQQRATELGLDYLHVELFELAHSLTKNETAPDIPLANYLSIELNKFIDEKCKTIGILETPTKLQVRSMVESRYKIFKELMTGKKAKILKNCVHCQSKRINFEIVNNSSIVIRNRKRILKNKEPKDNSENAEPILDDEVKEASSSSKGNTFFTPLDAKNHLRELWTNEKRVLKQIFSNLNCLPEDENPTDIFFYDVIAVSPNKFRPQRFMNGRKFDNGRTALLQQILLQNLTVNSQMKNLKSENSKEDKISEVTRFHYSWQRLQLLCNRLYDSEADKLPEKRVPGVKQTIEKKEGLFRKHMMGKRVNFAARSVILPDPYIMVDEVGIPLVFALKLTYPQRVTSFNIREMKQVILNGPLVYPGALSVIMADGKTVRLNPNDKNQRQVIANMVGISKDFRVRIVNRHLLSGDVLLLNRQPTLHKPSIMAHRARVLTGEKTMRLHYANCKSYNADFDGDEMNAHFPQSELARAEAYNIASVNQQLLVPKDGTPLSGLIQDHIVAAALMTMRGQFFSREDYHKLVFTSISFRNKKVRTQVPAIIKPVPLWSGKQIVSTVILNLIPENKPAPTFNISSKLKPKDFVKGTPKAWREGVIPLQADEMCESEVIIRNGELICGIMDKANLGATPYGLIHCCYEFYGGQVSTDLMTAFARLCSTFLQTNSGLTLGIHDILVKDAENKKRKKIIEKSKEVGKVAAAKALNINDYNDTEILIEKYREAHTSKNPYGLKLLDNCLKSEIDEINNGISKLCIDGLVKPFPENNLQLMIKSGAKGGTVNALQISCLMGQIELEGKRVPLMMSGKTLPSFVAYDTSPRAGGFVTGRFLTGIRPQEYFFHCMAGREGLIDTAVKTSRSGYLQRCLIKHLESLVVNYDLTVRDSDGSVIQFLYGEDGLDVTKNQLLKSKGLPIICSNNEIMKPTEQELELMCKNTEFELLKKCKNKMKKWIETNGKDRLQSRYGSAFQNYYEIIVKECKKICEENGKPFTYDDHQKIIQSWFDLDRKDRNKVNFYYLPCPGPLISIFKPDSNFSVISEKFESMMNDFQQSNPDIVGESGLISNEQFKRIIYAKYMKSLCDPGEAVGLLAAQSIGEPSTQMTLNTFHFAGRGEMNVTLGIPRLREILMTASPNIATPSMDIPLVFNEDADMDEVAEKLRLQLTSVRLSDVLESTTITETIMIDENDSCRVYSIRFKFLPYKCFKKKMIVTPSRILNFMEKKFFNTLIHSVRVKMDFLAKYESLYEDSMHTRGKKKVPEDEEGDISEIRGEADFSNKANTEQEEVSSDEEGENGDVDATDLKTKMQRDQDLSYDDPEEVEIEADSDVENNEDGDNQSIVSKGDQEDISAVNEAADSPVANESTAVVNELFNSSVSNENSFVRKKKSSKSKRREELIEQKPTRIKDVLSSNPCIYAYDFDVNAEEWCELQLRYSLANSKLDLGSIIEQEANNACIHKVGNIEKAFIVKDPEAANKGLLFDKMITTEGVSFLNMVKFSDVVDLKRIRSNDLHAVAQTFGIEAARRAMELEIRNVFAVYGIQIDPRHLSLVTDYMTCDGTIRGMNRISMTANSSPLQQMSFETTTSFLKSAVLLGYEDSVNSASARIFAGRPAGVGTGVLSMRAQKVDPNSIPLNPIFDDTPLKFSPLKRKSGRFSSSKDSFSSRSTRRKFTPRGDQKKRVSFNLSEDKPVNKRIKFTD
ncbi:DNA-directed RNA polymerase I subunit RPA1-like protein [Dinothrombium tinctorium]|uniref:DNA-directed RNA polymerase subunit n=2 Tax=Dinothrombium tinctorium TaxID=1965070 RepID=A0A443R5Y3_9ACAR|nr:DNA-directed RNA polymerase I subunit RPA1-like protein [Dinothrombium tinctorium]